METIELDLKDEDLLVLFKMAHEQDITFNQFVNEILRKKVEELENI